jgi:hypothetical protein
MHQLAELVVTSPAPVRAALSSTTLADKARQAVRWRPDPNRLAEPEQAARMALRSIARRIRELSEEITILDHQLSTLVHRIAPRTLALLGIGVGSASAPAPTPPSAPPTASPRE